VREIASSLAGRSLRWAAALYPNLQSCFSRHARTFAATHDKTEQLRDCWRNKHGPQQNRVYEGGIHPRTRSGLLGGINEYGLWR